MIQAGDIVTATGPTDEWANSKCKLKVVAISGDYAIVDVLEDFRVASNQYIVNGGTFSLNASDLEVIDKGQVTSRGIYRKGKVYNCGARS